MKHRFETDRREHSFRNIVLSASIFLIICLIFWSAVTSVSDRTVTEERATLEAALNRSIMHCYAIEGSYPESLDYLEEVYGLTYNDTLFYIDYQPLGADLMPDVTIIARKGEQQ